MTTLAVISTAASSADATGGANVASMLTMLIPLALIIVFFYFFIIRPEKKRNKDMLNSIQVADEVITNGGIIGRVLSVKEDTVLIETGSDRTKIRVLKSAIAKNNTVHEAPAEEAPAKKKKGDKPAEIK